MNAAGTNWLHENRLHEIISIVIYPFWEHGVGDIKIGLTYISLFTQSSF